MECAVSAVCEACAVAVVEPVAQAKTCTRVALLLDASLKIEIEKETETSVTTTMMMVCRSSSAVELTCAVVVEA